MKNKTVNFTFTVSPIPEISASGQDSVSALCQQLYSDLSFLSNKDDVADVAAMKTAPVQNSVAKQLFNNTTTVVSQGITKSSTSP